MSARRETACAAINVPTCMRAATTGYEWARNWIGQSGAAIYHLHGKSHAPDMFLKHGKHDVADDIIGEMVKLHWLANYIAVPQIIHFVSDPSEAWLLTAAMPGRSAYEVMVAFPENRIAIVDAMASFLRNLHAVPVSDCPFTSDHAFRLAQARKRIDAGLVDESDFDEERQGWSGEQVWDAMQRFLPFMSDPVATHGDFSLENILILDGEVAGCIDIGRAGIADRYQDLAILWNALSEFGTHLQDRLLAQYGITDTDSQKLEFHLLLDELF